MFEKPIAANDNESSENSDVLYTEYVKLRDSAPEEAKAMILERIDESLMGEEKSEAIISLADELNIEDPQRYRMVIEELCKEATLEKQQLAVAA